jgi:hypothetical protein
LAAPIALLTASVYDEFYESSIEAGAISPHG